MRADLARAADHRALDHRGLADVGAGVDHGAGRPRVLAQGDARREHRVRADAGAGRDQAVVADERGALDRVEVVDLHPVAEPHVPAQAHPGQAQAHALVERVEVRLPVLVEVADVLPVALADVAVERPAHVLQQREELLREVVGPVGGDVAQDLGLADVDPRVDRVGEDLAPRGLLEEALDPAALVGDDDPELERVVDRLEADRDGRALLLVRRDQLREVDVAERVAGDDEERLVEPAVGELHRAGRPGGRLLDGVLDRDAERLALPEVAADRLRHERDGDDHLREPVLGEELDDVLHAGLADDRDHRLGLVRRERAQARPLAARHHDGLHPRSSRLAVRTYWIPATTARTTPIQKHTSGQVVPSAVSITKKIEA